MKKTALIAALLAAALALPAIATEIPRLVQRDGRHALLVGNGDQVDHGLNLMAEPLMLKVKMARTR